MERFVVYQKNPISTTKYSPHGLVVVNDSTVGTEIHNHTNIEFKYILNDSGTTVTIGNNEYITKPGDFFTANSMVPHSFRTANPFSYMTIIFATEAWMDFGLDVNSIKFKEIVRDIEIDRIMNDIIKENASESPFFKIRVINLINEMIIHMLRFHTEKSPEPSGSFSESQKSIVNSINEYIMANYATKTDINSVAKHTGFNKSHIMRTYKSVTSMTILEKLYEVRVTHATEMLVNSKLSITDIAYANGFESLSHFGKIYRKYMGMSPSDIRRGM